MILSLQKGCAKYIGWYQSVKETQGSVEKSSFGQMKNIQEYGCYTIGSQSLGVHSKLSQLIRMDLEQRDKPLPQLKYSLDELRDLESKLVLITGRESKEKEQVDHFLNVSKVNTEYFRLVWIYPNKYNYDFFIGFSHSMPHSRCIS